MTLTLSEQDIRSLLNMKEVVPAVEECFRQQARSRAVNSPRTRTAVAGSSLNVMHASLPYLGRAGVKCYLASKRSTRFVFVLFRLEDGEPLAVMGADNLGRFRTGAASAVATKYLYGAKDLHFALCGSGRQALTQVLAIAEVAKLLTVKVWSPNKGHREALAGELGRLGFDAEADRSPQDALNGSDVVTAITSSKDPFLTAESVRSARHINLCGSNSPDRSEASPECVAEFQTVVVDDISQSRVESGDLIIAEREGRFSWDRAFELRGAVSGRFHPSGRTLFKSNGVAIEDVAVASLLYDRAVKQGEYKDRGVQLGEA
ncbi:MAG: ornithine cyclodeaminase family protein [Nitrososphaerales archaeon]|nr:ornithine cyclodeaminase family protein [Nitrososphaerales archaeon]